MDELKTKDGVLINKETGRDIKGRFVAGNSVRKGKAMGPREVTKQLREFAGANKITEKATKQLLAIVENKDGKYTGSEVIRASDLLLKTFNISAEKDMDKEIADDANKTVADMFADLKEMQSK